MELLKWKAGPNEVWRIPSNATYNTLEVDTDFKKQETEKGEEKENKVEEKEEEELNL